MDNLDETTIYKNEEYQVTYNKSAALTSGRYDERTDDVYEIEVYYLDNTTTFSNPTIKTDVNVSKNLNNLGKVFKDIEHNYTDFNLHFFDAANSIVNTTAIIVDDVNFSSTYSNEIDTSLIRFNNKFVSGGFIADYSSTSLNAFGNWNSGYARTGPNYLTYNNTGYGGYKWIAINVTNKKSGNRINLSGFTINGAYPVLGDFGNSSTGYRAYISHDNKFGSLERVSNSGETSWFNNASNTTITEADSINGALQTNESNSSLYDAFIDTNTSSQIYLIVGLPHDEDAYFEFA